MKIKNSNRKGTLILEMEGRDTDRLAEAGRKTLPFVIKTILVPTDFSDCSKKALRYAIRFAEELGAAVVLLNVIGFPPVITGEFTDTDLPLLQEQFRNENRSRLKLLAAEESTPATTIRELVRDGRPSDEILEVAKQEKADLIIISTHGEKGLRRMFMGSVAERVVRSAPCPVLVVREKETDFV